MQQEKRKNNFVFWVRLGSLKCFRTKNARKHGRSKGGKPELNDLLLWKEIIAHLKTKGRDINHTTFTYPQFLFSKQDASKEAAVGGYTCFGIAWRFIIPPEARKLVHIIILEFMAIIITICRKNVELNIRQ